MGMLLKNHFTSVSVKDRCMSPHGITGPRTKVQKFYWPETPNAAKIRCAPTKRARYCAKILHPRHPRSLDLSPIDRPYISFYGHSLVTLAFVSEISMALYRKCHFCIYPRVFHPNFGDIPMELLLQYRVMHYSVLVS